MKAIVIGGDIGGVTTALCLLQAGMDVELHERSAAPAEVGAGIQLPPNGMKVVGKLVLSDAISGVSFRPESLHMRLDQTGARIFSIPIRDQAVTRYGTPSVVNTRQDWLYGCDVTSQVF